MQKPIYGSSSEVLRISDEVRGPLAYFHEYTDYIGKCWFTPWFRVGNSMMQGLAFSTPGSCMFCRIVRGCKPSNFLLPQGYGSRQIQA